MKKITEKIIYQEYGKLIMDLKSAQKEKFSETAKKFSYLHFDQTYFSESYNKKDEKKFWEIIYFTSDLLTNSKCKIEKDIVEKCFQENMPIFFSISNLIDTNEEIPEYAFESILENHPQKKLISHIFLCYIKIDSDFSCFDVSLYSFVCAKSIIDAAIVADAGGFPVDEVLINKLNWPPPDSNDDEENELDELIADMPSKQSEELPELISDFKKFLAKNFHDSFSEIDCDDSDAFSDLLEEMKKDIEQEEGIFEEILEQHAALVGDDSISASNKRRKLLEEALEINYEDIQLHLMLIAEYKSFPKKMEICNRALEIAKTFIGDQEEFNQLEKDQLFYLEPNTRPYMQVLFSMATIYSNFGMHHKACQTYWELLELSPSDNLGARIFYVESLLERGINKSNIERIKTLLLDKFPDDTLPSTVWTRILLLLEENKMTEAKHEFKKATKYNKNIPKYLLDKNEYIVNIYEQVDQGSKEEAKRYCMRFKRFWSEDSLKKLKNVGGI